VEIHAIIVKQRISLLLSPSASPTHSLLWLQNFDCINNNFSWLEKRNRNGGEVEKAVKYCPLIVVVVVFFFI